MGNSLYRATSGIAPIEGPTVSPVNSALGARSSFDDVLRLASYDTGGLPQYGQGNSLFGNIDINGDWLGGAGDLLGGIAGIGQLWLGYEQMKDTRKNNSLYRSVMGEQQNQRSDFYNTANSAFGNGGKTNWNTSRPTSVNY